MSRNQSFVSLVCKVKVTKSCLKNTLSNFLEILFFSVPNVKSTRVNKATHKQSNMPREEMVVNTNVLPFCQSSILANLTRDRPDTRSIGVGTKVKLVQSIFRPSNYVLRSLNSPWKVGIGLSWRTALAQSKTYMPVR